VQEKCIRYVTSQPYGGVDRNGLSWRSGFAQVDDAVASAAQAVADDPSFGTCEVWVQRGVYGPLQGHRRFSLHPSVEVYGGFAGTETERQQRDVVAHTTWLEGYSGAFVISPNGGVLDGFTLSGSDTSGPDPAQLWGGALRHESGELTVRNGRFWSNRADRGGGAVYIASGTVTFEGCELSGNSGSHYYQGGAIYQAAGDLTIIDSVFSGNLAGIGGAIYLANSSSTLTVQGSRFVDNRTSGGSGGAIYGHRIAIDQSVFENNVAYSVGGGQGGAIRASEIEVDRSVFLGNQARDGWSDGLSARGGAIVCGDAELIGSTFVDNRSVFENIGGGLADTYAGAVSCTATVTAINSIFWQNPADIGPAIEARDLHISYSLVEGGADGEGNIDADPLFPPAEGKIDISLQPGSPCIDAAHGDYASERDIRDAERHDYASVPNTGTGTPSYADIGAWESLP
jgi:hypothetical protein